MVLPILLTLIYTFSWVRFQKYQFLERNYDIVAKHPEYSKKWHFWKGINQVSFFGIMLFTIGWKLTLLNALIFWVLFDALINKLILKRPFFFVGTTAFTDVTIQKSAKLISSPFKNSLKPEVLSGVLKILLIILIIILLF